MVFLISAHHHADENGSYSATGAGVPYYHTITKGYDMSKWTIEALSETIETFTALDTAGQREVLGLMNRSYPLPTYISHRAMRRNALARANRIKEILETGKQGFPLRKKLTQFSSRRWLSINFLMQCWRKLLRKE